MHFWVGFISNPKQRKRSIEGDLHAPTPGDDRPDPLKNRILHSKHRMLPYSEEIVAQLIAELRIRDSRDAQGHALAKKKEGPTPPWLDASPVMIRRLFDIARNSSKYP